MKVALALQQGLTPIFCIGETKEERESNRHFDVVRQQLRDGLFHLVKAAFRRPIIASEPVPALATRLTPSPEQPQCMHPHLPIEIAPVYQPGRDEETTSPSSAPRHPKKHPQPTR